eukprot:COSAG02_NODE_10727_length_1872_cov_2.859560_2_plen_176_part_00
MTPHTQMEISCQISRIAPLHGVDASVQELYRVVPPCAGAFCGAPSPFRAARLSSVESPVGDYHRVGTTGSCAGLPAVSDCPKDYYRGTESPVVARWAALSSDPDGIVSHLVSLEAHLESAEYFEQVGAFQPALSQTVKLAWRSLRVLPSAQIIKPAYMLCHVIASHSTFVGLLRL